MGKSIIIAEKPSVGRDYARVLGVNGNEKDGYMENEKWIVTWSIGHLVTMSYPDKYDVSLKEWSLDTLPFLPENFKYEVIEESKEQFYIIKNLYNRPDIDAIYYAGDAGREGIYIQMLIRQLTGHTPGIIERVVWIDSHTDEEMLRGIAEAKDIKEYMNLADSGYMRAIEDYCAGINFSRLLSVKYAVMLNSGTDQKKHKPISVGRVMTCVLGMIINREREIRNFKIKDFYRVVGILDIEGNEVECEWRVSDSSIYYQSSKLYSEFGFLKEETAQELIDTLSQDMKICRINKSSVHKNAPLLYNLAELQSSCAKELHISPIETLNIAQSLYEKKCITYPRTDARVLSTTIAGEINKILNGLEKGEYKEIIAKIRNQHWKINGKYINNSKITDHYAIIPTGNVPNGLSDKEREVYNQICKRFLAIFYPPAEYEQIKIVAVSGNERFYGTSKYLLTPGYYEVSGYPENDNTSKAIIAAMNKLKEGKNYKVGYRKKKGETAPPKRYSFGSIILAMEGAGKLIEDEELREQIKETGIGRSATRTDIVKKLINLNYIEVRDKNQILMPTNFGEMIFEIVNMTIPSMLSPEITAKWEKGLEQIANGEISKQLYESRMYDFIRQECEKVKSMNNMDEVMKKIRPYATNRIQQEYRRFDPYNTKIKCPLCGDEVVTTSWGFKCKSNISKTEGCMFMIGDILGHRLLTNELAGLLSKGKAGPFYDFISKNGNIFAAFLIWDDDTKKIKFDMVEMPWERLELKCPICSRRLLKRDNIYKCEANISETEGCKFRVGKIMGKSLPEKQINKLLTEERTDLIKGFKGKNDVKFDAFLYWDKDKEKVGFIFPEYADMLTKYYCPICNGKILVTSYGYKCENYLSPEKRGKNGCSFLCGSILGHTVKEKELQQILNGEETELIVFKNEDKKKFDARLYWDRYEKRIALKFDDNDPVELNEKCPVCGSNLIKTKYGYRCIKHASRERGCKFSIGAIAGVLIDEKQLHKLLCFGKTDLISGFKPKENGKPKFTASLKWNVSEEKIEFEFQNEKAIKETSSYRCPVCRKRNLIKTQYDYRCACGFKVNLIIGEKEIPEEQFRKLLLRGETDIIQGFYSRTRRKLFNAKIVIKDGKTEFCFPENETKAEVSEV